MAFSLKQVIENAEKNRIAIGHFNISNLEQLKAIATVAKKLNVPVIIGVSEGEREFIGVLEIVALVKSLKDRGFNIFLNADHTYGLEGVEKAAKAGFDAVLFDGGKLPFEENIKQTKKAVEIAKSINKDILVEGELGFIGSSSEIRKEIPKSAAISKEDLAKPEEALKFVDETGVDLLAPAVGNIHGMLARQNPPTGGGDGFAYYDAPLNISRIEEIKKATKIPLVLHGGSGSTDKEFQEAIRAGISIIHISTELRVAWRKGVEEALQKHPDEVAPYKLMPLAMEDMERVVEKKLKLFNKIS
ncbi:MAG: class II fructose-bisphosphate aldolase [Patescibacteria group bacterium]|nr:class II fructose-bisphosphate aldolase [Patescibacteria group bacterium]